MRYSTITVMALAMALFNSCSWYKSAYVNHEASEIGIGYGSIDGDNMTGAVTGKKANDKAAITATDMYEYLRGRFAGLEVIGTAPSARLRIRGESSNSNTADPLILVNGVEVTSIDNINPSDVSNVEVIKDGTASIYGMRGGNGVIMITLKGSK